jgi:hypothetical protein
VPRTVFCLVNRCFAYSIQTASVFEQCFFVKIKTFSRLSDVVLWFLSTQMPALSIQTAITVHTMTPCSYIRSPVDLIRRLLFSCVYYIQLSYFASPCIYALHKSNSEALYFTTSLPYAYTMFTVFHALHCYGINSPRGPMAALNRISSPSSLACKDHRTATASTKLVSL